MASSHNRKAVEIPLPLHEALSLVAGKQHDTLARLVAHALHQWLQEHHPAQAPKDAYLTPKQKEEYYYHERKPIHPDGYRRF